MTKQPEQILEETALRHVPIGCLESSNGNLNGKWKEKLFKKDGGHAMIFNTFDSKMILTLHQPNSGDIRARLFEVFEENEILKVGYMIDLN